MSAKHHRVTRGRKTLSTTPGTTSAFVRVPELGRHRWDRRIGGKLFLAFCSLSLTRRRLSLDGAWQYVKVSGRLRVIKFGVE